MILFIFERTNNYRNLTFKRAPEELKMRNLTSLWEIWYTEKLPHLFTSLSNLARVENHWRNDREERPKTAMQWRKQNTEKDIVTMAKQRWSRGGWTVFELWANRGVGESLNDNIISREIARRKAKELRVFVFF